MMLSRIGIIVLKEFRQKARGLATVGVLTFVLAIIAVVSYMILLSGYSSLSVGYSSTSAIGRSLAIGVLIVQMILMAVFGLSFNGSAITQERDRETIDLMNLTLLGNADIILGKMASSMIYIILLLFAGLPFFALSYTFGGWELGELAAAMAVELALVFLVSAWGLFISVTSKDTRAALGRTFAVLIFGAVITLYFGVKIATSLQTDLNFFEKALGLFSLLFNPAFALWSVLYPDYGARLILNIPGISSISGIMPIWLAAAVFETLCGIIGLIVAINVYRLIRRGER